MEEITIKNYQELAMRTCLPSAKNWKYCYCLIASEIGEAFGKWGKKFRDGSFDKDKLADELGDVFWGLALACELGGYNFEKLWNRKIDTEQRRGILQFKVFCPKEFFCCDFELHISSVLYISRFTKTFAEQCGIDPLDCLRRNIAKLADRQERGVIKGNGDER